MDLDLKLINRPREAQEFAKTSGDPVVPWSDEYGAKYEVIRERYSSDLPSVLDREAADRRGARSGRRGLFSGYSRVAKSRREPATAETPPGRAPLSTTQQGLHPARRQADLALIILLSQALSQPQPIEIGRRQGGFAQARRNGRALRPCSIGAGRAAHGYAVVARHLRTRACGH